MMGKTPRLKKQEITKRMKSETMDNSALKSKKKRINTTTQD